MSTAEHAPPGPVRTLLALSLTSCLATVWTHALAMVLAAPDATEASEVALPLTLLGVLVSLAAGSCSRARPSWLAATGIGVMGFLILQEWVPSATVEGVALVPVALASAALTPWMAHQLPEHLERAARRHRLRSALWLLATLLAIVQMARLSTWATDPSSDWFLSTRNPFWAKHECLNAYVYGAELASRGEPNVYAAEHYPALRREAEPQTRMQAMTVEDPYQYAPQFLLWPAAAAAATDHYPTLRTVWLALQTTFFLFVALWLAVRVGGRTGEFAGLLVPLALSAFPMLHALQYGQFHLAALVLAVGAMLAFEQRRPAWGGAMLAVAVLSKVFPGILLLPLIAQRRWRELGWTAAFAAMLTAGTLGVFGTAPYVAFVEYHLPRLQTGAAFAFQEAWPEIREFMIADNQGIYGLFLKLEALGVPGMSASLGVWLNRVYALGVAAAAVLVGLRMPRFTLHEKAVTWISLYGLASLASTGAFGDYVPLTATWLLTLVAYRAVSLRVLPWLVGAWIMQYTLLGTTPIGSYFEPTLMYALSTLAMLSLLGIFAWSLTDVARSGHKATHTVPEGALPLAR